jgi:Ca2+-binding RTX toxin-like protein
VVTLSGTASLVDYQTAIRAITFANASENPNTTPRTVTIAVRDGTLVSNTATTTISVTAVNDPPVAGADSASTNEDVVLSIPIATLLANDSDVDGGTLSITSVQGAVNGTVAIVGSNVVFTPNLHHSGPASFTYTLSDGQGGTATGTVNLTINAVADAPNLTVQAQAPVLVFNNSWEANVNSDTTSTQNTVTAFEGWTRVDTPEGLAGGTNAFEIWTTGDSQQRQDGGNNTIVASAGNGEDFLEFNDAANLVQTIGITRSVATQAGMVYELSFDFAGRPGFSADFTRIGVYVDGVLQQQYASTSPQTFIDWQNAKLRLQGDGGTHTITIRTDATQFNNAGRGAFIDDVRLSATQGVVAGNAGAITAVALASYVSAALVDADGSEFLTLSFSGIPAGAIIVTASNPGGYSPSGGTINITGAELASAQLQLPTAFNGHLSLGVTARATETSNGSTATTSSTLELDVLGRSVVTDLGGDGLNNQIGTTANNTLSGTANADYQIGLDGNDTLNGSGGNDWLDGGNGTDVLSGGNGNDVLYGGAGNDTLTGGAGADVFAWTLTDRGTPGAAPTDTITDFNNAAGGDVLDLRDLLVGEHTGNLANYLHFSTSGGNTTISVSSTGAFSGGFSSGAVDQVIQITGVNLVGSFTSDAQIAADLLSRGKLVIDA